MIKRDHLQKVPVAVRHCRSSSKKKMVMVSGMSTSYTSTWFGSGAADPKLDRLIVSWIFKNDRTIANRKMLVVKPEAWTVKSAKYDAMPNVAWQLFAAKPQYESSHGGSKELDNRIKIKYTPQTQSAKTS